MENNEYRLHQNLGKLFYAIAIADKQINTEEIAALKTTILKNWYTLDTGPNGFHLDGHQEIFSVFTHLQNTKAKSDTCFMEFREFFNENRHYFTEDIMKLIWDTSQAIACSFAQKNKSELILLAKLKILFES
ncbi:MAG: hypothetical protein HKP49_05395 [Maribacter sp.]|nr:hypothetical protein [Maribacter sp.]